MYNSNFAKFANSKVPTGKVDIVGIFKRFNNQWEIVIRSLDDIKPAEKVDPFKGLPGKGDGTQANPLDITRALAYAKLNKKDANTYYIKGIISQIDEVSTQYSVIARLPTCLTMVTTTDQLQVVPLACT